MARTWILMEYVVKERVIEVDVINKIDKGMQFVLAQCAESTLPRKRLRILSRNLTIKDRKIYVEFDDEEWIAE